MGTVYDHTVLVFSFLLLFKNTCQYQEKLGTKRRIHRKPFCRSTFLGSLWSPLPCMLSGLCWGSPSLCVGPTPGVCGSRPWWAAVCSPRSLSHTLWDGPDRVPCGLGTRRKPQRSREIIHSSNQSKVFKLENGALMRRNTVVVFFSKSLAFLKRSPTQPQQAHDLCSLNRK